MTEKQAVGFSASNFDGDMIGNLSNRYGKTNGTRPALCKDRGGNSNAAPDMRLRRHGAGYINDPIAVASAVFRAFGSYLYACGTS
jgi:hypothetical protein